MLQINRGKEILLVLLFLIINFLSYSNNLFMEDNDTITFTNKIIPPAILDEANIALSYYPQLKDTPIEFKFKKKIKKSFMQAQPKLSSLFRNRKDRAYIIFISKGFNIEDELFDISEIPSDVLIGWLGHELGHVMDYRDRSSLNMLGFGLRYITSPGYIREAERAADTYAVRHGMREYILATKNFILSHANLSEAYKQRIMRLYLSPEEILDLIEEVHD
jgi:hypothetical protein